MGAPGTSVDVLVLGATVAGLTTAVEAALAGARVVVLDPHETTRFGFGLLTLGQGGRLREIELHRGVGAAKSYVEWTRRAIEWIGQTLPPSGLEITERTAYGLAVDGHMAFHLIQEARLLRLAGVAVETTDVEPLPVKTRPALMLTGQGQVDPHDHRTVLEKVTQAAGVQIVRRARANSFTRDRAWHVAWTDDQGRSSTTTAEHVVDTIGVAPWGRYGFRGLLKTTPVVVADPAEIPDDLYVFADTSASIIVTLRHRLLVLGHPVPADREQAAAGELVGWVRGTLGAEVRHVRTQHVEITPDRVPVVGSIPMLGGAWVARGFGGFETTSGTAAGLQVSSAMMSGAEQPWAPLRLPVGPLALWRRWTGDIADPMVHVPAVLRRRGLARD